MEEYRKQLEWALREFKELRSDDAGELHGQDKLVYDAAEGFYEVLPDLHMAIELRRLFL